MEITEVRVRLADDTLDDRVHAYCSVVIDKVLAIHELRVVDGERRRIVSMPSRKITDHCPDCNHKNPLAARYCNQCGNPLHSDRAVPGPNGRIRFYADIAHPIDPVFRRKLDGAILHAVEQAEADPTYDYSRKGGER